VNLLELLRLAFGRLRTSRLRSVLTMLGVIIGVASVVALVSVGEGATAGITSQIQALGTNLLTVNPGSSTTGLTNLGFGTADTLTLGDSDAIAALGGIAAVAPEVTTSKLVIAGTKNTTTSIVGTTADYASVRNQDIYQGTFLNDASDESSLRVAVVGSTTATDLGLTAADVGSDITIGGLPFRVVGLLQPTGGVGNQDDQILVPLSVVQREFVSGDSVRSIFVSVADKTDINQAKAEITAALEQRHGTSGTNDDFSISDQSQLLDTFSSVSGLLSLLLAGIASISLVVGGIGIMNIMLVSVRERTREIGIRKAIGAKRRTILLQFLIEAATICLIGGAIGLGIAWPITLVLHHYMPATLSPTVVSLALLVSLATGVLSGFVPAWRAARMNPVDALRNE
jgi:putative ABC transport system permease protein